MAEDQRDWSGQDGRSEAMGPAREFLLTCLRSRFDPQALETARRLVQSGRMDWAAVEGQIGQEGIGPLLFATTRGRELLPPELEQQLQQVYINNATRNTLLLNELPKVLTHLTQAGLPVLVLKGAALLQEVYGNIALRPMVDLDLLVRKEDVAHALRAVQANGYRLTDIEVHAGMALEFENEVLLMKPGQVDILLELHWHLLDSPYHQERMDLEWCWTTAASTRFEGAAGLVLGPEALLLHLCSHLAIHHGGDWLLWLHDVAEVLHRYQSQLDWESLLGQAAASDLILPLQQILPRVADQWQVPLPDAVRERLAAFEPSAAELKAFRGLTAESRPLARRFWAELASMPGWRRRIRYAWRNLFPSVSYMRRRYGMRHTYLLPFYYFYRWYQGVRRIV
jgi:hypothetical protein